MASITSFFPASAYAGDIVAISGIGFTGATAVSFGGVVAASFVIVDDETINAIVGNTGATGDVDVTTPTGVVTKAGFTFSGVRPVGSKIKMPNSPPYPDGAAPIGDDLVWVYDTTTQTLRQSKISALPFSAEGGGGGGTVTNLGSPFAVRPTDGSYIDNGDGSCTITDVRLVGKTDFAISSTQLNIADFEDGQVTYDPVNGKVTITNFQLQAGEKIRIYADGVVNSQLSAFMASVQTKMAKYDQMLAVFTPTALGATRARVWWTGPISEIPVGWVVDTDQAGKIPIPQDTTDDDFKVNPGTSVGSKDLVISSTDMLPKFSLFTVVDDQLFTPGHPSSIGRAISNAISKIRYYLKTTGGVDGTPGTESYEFCGATDNTQIPTLAPTSPIGKANPDAMKNIPAGIIGVWIKYAGV
jgi:hypothetical protein